MIWGDWEWVARDGKAELAEVTPSDKEIQSANRRHISKAKGKGWSYMSSMKTVKERRRFDNDRLMTGILTHDKTNN